MRFNQYLTEMLELSQIEDINQLIHENCKPYLKLIKGKVPLYRGLGTSSAVWGDI